MNIPGFAAEVSLYRKSGCYHSVRQASNLSDNMITPAIPACRNCDAILEMCENNGWRPRAVCNACANGYCYEDPPIPNPFPDPFKPLPRF